MPLQRGILEIERSMTSSGGLPVKSGPGPVGSMFTGRDTVVCNRLGRIVGGKPAPSRERYSYQRLPMGLMRSGSPSAVAARPPAPLDPDAAPKSQPARSHDCAGTTPEGWRDTISSIARTRFIAAPPSLTRQPFLAGFAKKQTTEPSSQFRRLRECFGGFSLPGAASSSTEGIHIDFSPQYLCRPRL